MKAGGAITAPFQQPTNSPFVLPPAQSWTDQGTTAQAQGGTAFSNPPSQPPQAAPVAPASQPGDMLGQPAYSEEMAQQGQTSQYGGMTPVVTPFVQPETGGPGAMPPGSMLGMPLDDTVTGTQPGSMDQAGLQQLINQMGQVDGFTGALSGLNQPPQAAGPVAPSRFGAGLSTPAVTRPAVQAPTGGSQLNTPQVVDQPRRDMGSRGGVAGAVRPGQMGGRAPRPAPTMGAALNTPRPANTGSRDRGSRTNPVRSAVRNKPSGGGGLLGSLFSLF
jgi:hypothetical protein